MKIQSQHHALRVRSTWDQFAPATGSLGLALSSVGTSRATGVPSGEAEVLALQAKGIYTACGEPGEIGSQHKAPDSHEIWHCLCWARASCWCQRVSTIPDLLIYSPWPTLEKWPFPFPNSHICYLFSSRCLPEVWEGVQECGARCKPKPTSGTERHLSDNTRR